MSTTIEQQNQRILKRLSRLEARQPKAGILLDYAQQLSSSNLPIIFSFQHLKLLLGIKSDILGFAIFRSENFYRTFSIPKRRGGTRQIDAPSPILLHCQRWIASNILNELHTDDRCHGFRRGRSAKTNAQLHVGCKDLLHVDIKDFFPSIKIARVVHLFRKLGYSPAVSFYLGRLCCKDGQLAQGAATSPALSNSIMLQADLRIGKLAEKSRLTYTRYADDITLSGESINPRIIQVISRILSENGFQLNPEKTRIARSRGRKIITGLSICGGKISLPKGMRRALRAQVHSISKDGVLRYMNKHQISDPLFIDRLIGKLTYWKHIEPENKFVSAALETVRLESEKLE